MFGADTPLVIDALQIGALSLLAGGGAAWLLLRQSKSVQASPDLEPSKPGTLEERVRVLERIATDREGEERAGGLAEEIEALRDKPTGAAS